VAPAAIAPWWPALDARAAGAATGPFLGTAEWLWTPIPADPVLDASSATWASLFSTGAKVLNTYDYGAPFYATHDGSGNRRPGSWQTVAVSHTEWGGNPFASYNPIWVPADAAPSPQSDAAMSIVDTSRNLIFEFWQARRSAAGVWSAGWGGVLSLTGRGNRNSGNGETGQQGGVGAGISRRAGLVTRDDIASGVIGHALVLSTDIAMPTTVRYPATKTDGANLAGSATPIPQAARLQLDPAADLSALGGYQRMIARALQTHGAYVVDNGGARAAIIAEGQDPAGPKTGTPYFSAATPVPGNPVFSGSTFWSAGMRDTGSGYQSLAGIPWSRIRVLRTWDGS
jgi:hypothetical protein